jgi:hypothetical protein
VPADFKYSIESYRAGTITRREFMRRAMLWTGSVAVASSLLDSLSPAAVHANQVDPNDPTFIQKMLNIPQPMVHRSAPTSLGRREMADSRQ